MNEDLLDRLFEELNRFSIQMFGPGATWILLDEHQKFLALYRLINLIWAGMYKRIKEPEAKKPWEQL